ncbi:MAG: hypothetical protein IH619_06455 [Ignavibacterium sp.]|nr:hypothetical protein [Ignavibacterium sp.]
MDKILNNKWNLGKANFGTHKVSKAYKDFNGIYTVYAALDNSIGTEVILYIRDETDFIYDVAKVRPFDLFMKSGVVRTEFGPLLFLLFFIPDPRFEDRPFAMFDDHLNPLSPEQLSVFYDLSRQTHWHLFLINKENEQIEFFEFENNYGLYETLQTVEEACKGMQSIDFLKAQEQFINKYSLADLYRM